MDINTPLTEIFRLTEKQKESLKKIKLKIVRDLLFYFPSRYSNISQIKKIGDITVGEDVVIYGKLTRKDIKKSFKDKKLRAEGEIEDATGKIKVLWFNQMYFAKMIHVGYSLELTGKVSESKNGLYISNPEFKKIKDLPIDIHNSLFQTKEGQEFFSFPIYPETKFLSSKWFYHAIQKIIKDESFKNIIDYIPEEIIKKYHLPPLKTALIWIHSPKKEDDAVVARKRFAFEEVFFIQLERNHDKIEYRKNKSFSIKIDDTDVREFTDRFPFKMTLAQEKAINQIKEDLTKNYPMTRLLEGDVGSGKTAVAATAAYAIIKNRPAGQNFGNLEIAYMAPTEILANQHFESFISYFKHLNINIGLITGSGCKKFPSKVSPEKWTAISRPQLLKWLANGEIPILIGTHSLIQKTVKFKNLALGIIDEQHRFGTAQRNKLVRRDNIAPHLLSMTATPIPRTLALTIYGDLDLTLLDQMPAGRKNVITEIISPDKREGVYEDIKKEMAKGRQLYVICPRIDEPDPEKLMAINAKSAIAEAKRLKKDIFPKANIEVLHSKISKDRKEKIMKDFSEGKTDILVATSVIEVGVNVPNATLIIIEGAERFGLAQLHQLRGRVLRSSDQAYCYVFAETKSQKTIDRLNALKTAKNGFELSELDLTLRGPGELSGNKQWGITDLGMEAIKNIKMVEAARVEAERMIKEDLELTRYPDLKAQIKIRTSEFHFE